MQSPDRTSTQLDLVRDDAAARQRRAATYRTTRQHQPPHARRSICTTAAALLLSVGVIGGAAASVLDDPTPQGHRSGLVDGWFDPTAAGGTVTTSEDSIRPAPSVTPQSYLPGRPDGWFQPIDRGVQVAGIVVSRSSLVPHNVR